MVSHKRPVGFGSSGPTGREVDEDALVRRYVKLKWPLKRCANAARISSERAKKILEANGVELRQPAKPLDDNEVIRAYETHGSYANVATIFEVEIPRIKDILDAHGIEVNERTMTLGPAWPKAK